MQAMSKTAAHGIPIRDGARVGEKRLIVISSNLVLLLVNFCTYPAPFFCYSHFGASNTDIVSNRIHPQL